MKVDLDELVDELRSIKYDEGIDHVSSKKLSRRLENTPKELGYALSSLEDRGLVERVAYSSRTTWRIEIEEGAPV